MTAITMVPMTQTTHLTHALQIQAIFLPQLKHPDINHLHLIQQPPQLSDLLTCMIRMLQRHRGTIHNLNPILTIPTDSLAPMTLWEGIEILREAKRLEMILIAQNLLYQIHIVLNPLYQIHMNLNLQGQTIIVPILLVGILIETFTDLNLQAEILTALSLQIGIVIALIRRAGTLTHQLGILMGVAPLTETLTVQTLQAETLMLLILLLEILIFLKLWIEIRTTLNLRAEILTVLTHLVEIRQLEIHMLLILIFSAQ